MPHELTKNQKIVLKCCLLLFYATTMNHFLIGLWCVTKVDLIWQLVMISSVVGPKRSSKALPRLAKICTKKRSWWLSVDLLPVWSITAFWILVKPLCLRSMLSRPVRCTENCKANGCFLVAKLCLTLWDPKDCRVPGFLVLHYALSLLYDPTLTFVHDYWKNCIFDCIDLCWQSDVSTF